MNRKIGKKWLVVIFIMTVPFIYIESGAVTAGMVFIIYAMQLFQMWSVSEVLEDQTLLFKNQASLMRMLVDLKEEK